MSDKIRANRKIPFLEDLADKSPLLQEVQLREVRKNLIRGEALVLEPRADQDVAKLITRQDDLSKPWYIPHV